MGTIKNKVHSKLSEELMHYRRQQTSAQYMMDFWKHQSYDPYEHSSQTAFERQRRNEITYYHMCLRDYSRKCSEIKKQIYETQREYTLTNKKK